MEEGFASGLDHVFLISAGMAFAGAIAAVVLIRGRDLRGGDDGG